MSLGSAVTTTRPALHLRHIIAQRPGDRIERQRAVDEPLAKFQAAQFLLPVDADGPIGLAGFVHAGNIVDRMIPVSRFSDIDI